MFVSVFSEIVIIDNPLLFNYIKYISRTLSADKTIQKFVNQNLFCLCKQNNINVLDSNFDVSLINQMAIDCLKINHKFLDLIEKKLD